MHVLVVEDETAMRVLTVRALTREGFDVVEAADGQEALRAARVGGFEVALIDLGLPDMSGLDLIPGLRHLLPDLHVIILSGAGSEVERVRGLFAGADDYLVKPISLRELAARLIAVERRRAFRGGSGSDATPGRLLVGDIAIDLPARTVHQGGSEVDLTRREFDLLSYLALHPGVTVSRERLLEVVWSSSASWQSVSTVTEHVRRLRAKLKADPAHPRLIVTIRGAGYRFDQPAAEVATTRDGDPLLVHASDRTSRLRQQATGVGVEVSDAVITTSPELRIESFNHAAERLYGWREAQIVGRALFDVIPWIGGDTDEVGIGEHLRKEARWRGMGEQRRRDGTSVRVRAVVTQLRDPEGGVDGVVWVNRPVEGDVAPLTEMTHVDHELAADLRRGLAAGEFEVAYQPIVRLADRSLLAVEALARWRHPTRGLLTPAAFIDLAERTGAIVELGQQILESACAQQQIWRTSGHDLHLSVNLSTLELADSELPERIEEIMVAHDVPVGALWLEVTETSLISDIEQAKAVLERTEMLGACMLIDDFGTGWAGLTYLREFPVQAIKIDTTFVAGLGAEARARAVVRSILTLGRELGHVVIAEGIETEAQLAHLVSLGCRAGQGYLFGHPVAARDLELS
ncbi:MAG: EAL domain-containing protein [Acidimicrobiales bacterium]